MMWWRNFNTMIRRGAKRVFMPVVAFVATLYFVVDVLFLSIVRPVAARLSQSPLVALLAARLGKLGAYPTLALFLVPVLVLEPVKPIGLYLMGSGHVMTGVLVITVGEILKVTLVERLFHIGRDKLMSIRAFAWSYKIVKRVLAFLWSQPGWQLVVKNANAVRSLAYLTARRLRTISLARGRRGSLRAPRQQADSVRSASGSGEPSREAWVAFLK
jgi:hypothetical protein